MMLASGRRWLSSAGSNFQLSATNDNISSRSTLRFLSSAETIPATITEKGHTIDVDKAKVTTPEGREFVAFEPPRFYGKLKPHIVKRRLGRMRTYEGGKKNIRHSPWRMNLVCQLAAGLTLEDALLQLHFCPKKMAPVVSDVLRDVARTADVRHGLQPSQLEVAECFATKGTPLKRMKIMGRGRTGKMEHRHTHFRVVLREIDFKLRMYQAPSLRQKKKWLMRQHHAEQQFEQAQQLRQEMEELKAQEAAFRKKNEAKDQ